MGVRVEGAGGFTQPMHGCGREAETHGLRGHQGLVEAPSTHQHCGIGGTPQLLGNIFGQSNVVVAW